MPKKGMRSLWFSTARPSSSMSLSPSPSRGEGSLIPRRLFSDAVMERTLVRSQAVIGKWDPESSTFAKVTSLFYENRREALDFVDCVKRLHRAMHFLASENSAADKLVVGQTLMQTAMNRLQKEFYQILSLNRALLDPESVSARSSLTSTRSSISEFGDGDGDGGGIDDEIRVAGNSISEMENISVTVMEDLRLIAECMISCGYGKECVQIYKIMRKSVIDEAIYKLGVEKLSSTKVQKMDWEVLELKIKCWLEAVKVAVKSLFHGEKFLCDQVFPSLESIRESCFAETSKEGALILFGFPETVSKHRKKSPNKIFRLLDMCTAIADHLSEIESIFSFEATSTIRSQAITSLAKLGECVRSELADFESTLQKDNSKFPVAVAGIHPLTVDAMSYLSTLADYSAILGYILADSPLPSLMFQPESYFAVSDPDDSPAPATSRRFAWLILVLLCKLDGKAKHIKDVSLAYLFLANNLSHVIYRVRRSNLRYLLGDDWVSKQESQVKQFAACYRRLAWYPVTMALSEDPAAPMSPEEVKERFKRFNLLLDQVHRKQSSCVVSDNKLRGEIKTSIIRELVPAYREFYKKHKHSLRRDRNLDDVVKFTPENLGKYLSNLLLGGIGSGSSSSYLPSSSH